MILPLYCEMSIEGVDTLDVDLTAVFFLGFAFFFCCLIVAVGVALVDLDNNGGFFGINGGFLLLQSSTTRCLLLVGESNYKFRTNVE